MPEPTGGLGGHAYHTKTRGCRFFPAGEGSGKRNLVIFLG
jgi:hypothetical protein